MLVFAEAKGTVDGDEIIIYGQKLRTSGAQRANIDLHSVPDRPWGTPAHKVLWSESQQRMAADAMNLLGPESLIVADGYGLSGWQQAFLTSRSDTIWGGTAEIQRNIIAERLLGLPKEPRSSA